MQGRGLVRTAITWVVFVSVALTGSLVAAAEKPQQIRVGYFQQWPAPMQFAQHKKTFDAVLGLTVEWVPFRSGSEMATALAGGSLQIAHSLGQVPFMVAANSGAEISVVGVAVSYPDDDNCILRADAGITRANAAELSGKTVALRPGSVTHFRLLKVLQKLAVDPQSINIMSVADGEAALQALQDGDAVMACGHGSALRAMNALGQPLLSGNEQDAMGLKLFDVIAVENGFMQDHGDLIQSYLQVVDAANQQWKSNPDSMLRTIARAAYMDRASTRQAMQDFQFPTLMEQNSDAWLGAGTAAYTLEMAEFFSNRGQLPNTLTDYSPFITTRFLR